MISIVLGTKAQLIKMAPIMVELKRRKINYNFVLTGQHKETMTDLLENFGIKKPNYILYSGKDVTGIGQMGVWFVKVLLKSYKERRKIFKKEGKNIILVHGDTFSTLLGALLGKIINYKVGHIESGLRSFNLFNPFPEEITRILTFNLSDYYFCPNDWALNNLKKYKGKKVNTKQNTLLDALNSALKNKSKIKIDVPKEKYCVVTIHRFENIFNKEKLTEIVNIVKNISKKIKVLFILHPPTKKQLSKYYLFDNLKESKSIELRPRYDYFEFIKLIDSSEFVVSDGGSNQEECYYLGKPCLLLRKETERKEGLNKNIILSRFDESIIENFVSNYKQFICPPVKVKISPSKIIVDSLEEFVR